MFYQIKKLIDNNFPRNQILVIVNPILPNDNGLRCLKLLLNVFTEFKPLRLRYIRFQLLSYRPIDYKNEQRDYKNEQRDSKNEHKFTIANNNIAKRNELLPLQKYLIKNASFITDYYKLISDYRSIICVDKGDEYLIGIRELIVFGYKNEWINESGIREKLITYEKGSKTKPILNVISDKKPVRCENKCLLCPWSK
jgi:hypothetical protein